MLAERGVTVIPPGEGELASHGERGVGRLPEPPELCSPPASALLPGNGCARRAAAVRPGGRVLVTAGGTREPIDSVRYIGNRSSGRMGFALAARGARARRRVTLVAAQRRAGAAGGRKLVQVETAGELAEACTEEFPTCDVLLMAAAVADFRPAAAAAAQAQEDRRRGAHGDRARADRGRADPAGSAAAHGQLLVGFAAEHGDGRVAYGREKLERKRLDAIVINDISRADIGFDAARNEVVILTRDGGERPRPAHCQGAGRGRDPGPGRSGCRELSRAREWAGRRAAPYTK